MAAVKLPLPREHTGDRQTQAMQVTAGRTASTLNGCPFIVGNHVEDLTITAGANNRVAHGLGRKVRGYIVTRSDSADQIYETDPSIANDDKFLDLTAAVAGGLYSIWFF